MSLLADQVVKRARGSAPVRYGYIESAANGLASVRIGSSVVDNATWLRGYLPSVGDRVAVLASGSGWLILDAVESAQRAYNEPETILVRPTSQSRLWNRLWSSSWDDDLITPEIDPKRPDPITDGWDALFPYDFPSDPLPLVQTGYYYNQSGDGSLSGYIPSNGLASHFFWYPALADQIPADAVIESVSLVLRMWEPAPSVLDHFLPAENGRVVLHGHSQPPVETAPGSAPEAYLNPAFPEIDAGRARPGDAVVIPLSQAYVDGLSDGSLAGLVVWPGETQERIVFGDARTYAWNEGGWYDEHYSSNDCFSLQVSYVTPYAED